MAVGEQPPHGGKPSVTGERPGRDHRRGRGIVDAGGVADGDSAVACERRAQPGQVIDGDTAADALVSVYGDGALPPATWTGVICSAKYPAAAAAVARRWLSAASASWSAQARARRTAGRLIALYFKSRELRSTTPFVKSSR